jgi:hypothetical protein
MVVSRCVSLYVDEHCFELLKNIRKNCRNQSLFLSKLEYRAKRTVCQKIRSDAAGSNEKRTEYAIRNYELVNRMKQLIKIIPLKIPPSI